jgi:o-succinylbenzoate---CoA ligase
VTSRGEEALSIRAAARDRPDGLALVAGVERFSWSGLAELAEREAERIRELAGVPGAGGPVALVATPTAETVARLLALAEMGVAAAPLHPRATPAEREAQAASLGCRVVLEGGAGVRRMAVPEAAPATPRSEAKGARTKREAPAEGAAPDHERPFAVLFTSGSAGSPRGVELSRGAFVAAAEASADRLGWREEDRWLCVLPLAHVGGLSILVRCLVARRAVVLLPGFEPAEVARAVERCAATLASLVPTMLARLLEELPAWRPPATLRAVLLGGAAAGPRLWRAGLERGLPLLETYGMTETCSQVATAVPGGPPRAMRPLPGLEVRTRDGRIEVRGPALLTRYLPPRAHPDPFTADGWFRTGDAGRLRDDGTLQPLGRLDAVIVTGGENVSPSEVEAELEAHPSVLSAVVVGIPDDRWGEVVAAALVRDPTSPPVGDDELLRWAAPRLAPFRRPRRIAWMDRLPEMSGGKVDRPAIVRLLSSPFDR